MFLFDVQCTARMSSVFFSSTIRASLQEISSQNSKTLGLNNGRRVGRTWPISWGSFILSLGVYQPNGWHSPDRLPLHGAEIQYGKMLSSMKLSPLLLANHLGYMKPYKEWDKLTLQPRMG